MRMIIRLILPLLTIALAGCAAMGGSSFRSDVESDAKSWLHENFDAANDKFTFAIITDLNSGERAGVFEVAVEQLNLLRPEFIISVGDLINGGSEDEAGLNAEWDGFDERASNTTAPFFHVGGNEN